MKSTSVLIADTNLLIRRGIHALLSDQKDINVVAEAETPAELLSLSQELHPEVVTIDCAQSEGFSLEDVVTLKATAPQTNLLVITTHSDKETILEALNHGICSYVLKECGEQEILNALYATAKGERYICSKVLDVILAENKSAPEPITEKINLTPRELEIIQLIAEGKSTAEIAEQLFLSPHTINSHRKNILRKMQIKSPAELIVKALDLGIVKIR
ncbi:LuxR C-terminal-related transcriptional regulator [Pontibacter silvestris]|uniref:LuxR C-terminal-related transcriptional regulator n=1 Tax=Pontibacter silvestris TaxID=2305183 RepID=A0ABW4X483_9BACT|nr:response regulator transcription factor [Pontibacter silvestris]MCC9134866.1 response regulator transcription factor [Pontibacter silvestris]